MGDSRDLTLCSALLSHFVGYPHIPSCSKGLEKPVLRSGLSQCRSRLEKILEARIRKSVRKRAKETRRNPHDEFFSGIAVPLLKAGGAGGG